MVTLYALLAFVWEIHRAHYDVIVMAPKFESRRDNVVVTGGIGSCRYKTHGTTNEESRFSVYLILEPVKAPWICLNS